MAKTCWNAHMLLSSAQLNKPCHPLGFGCKDPTSPFHLTNILIGWKLLRCMHLFRDNRIAREKV